MFQVKGVMAQADAITLPFPDGFFHCVVTSPPYWAMREYQGEAQIRVWGGDPDCDHKWKTDRRKLQTGGKSKKQTSNKGVDGSGWDAVSAFCEVCFAWRGALGHEPTATIYVANIVDIFKELHRVTRPDAVIWLNLGDSSSKGGQIPAGNRSFIPHRVALALQEDGWCIRQDTVWFKPNPMVESLKGIRWERHRIKIKHADVDWREAARDRGGILDGPTHVSGGNTGVKGKRPEWQSCPGCAVCTPNGGYFLRRGSWRHTTAHEYVFQVTKGMQYFVDQTLILEETSHGALEPSAGQKQADLGQNQGDSTLGVRTEFRNPRSVFRVNAGNYPGSHYSTYPEGLIFPLIRASCPTRTCAICAKPWAPVMDLDKDVKPSIRVAYRRTCEHVGAGHVPGWLLDPFFGSGTTGLVARSVGVNFAGIDISYKYLSENARVRAFKGTPPTALDDLPMFSEGIS